MSYPLIAGRLLTVRRRRSVALRLVLVEEVEILGDEIDGVDRSAVLLEGAVAKAVLGAARSPGLVFSEMCQSALNIENREELDAGVSAVVNVEIEATDGSHDPDNRSSSCVATHIMVFV